MEVVFFTRLKKVALVIFDGIILTGVKWGQGVGEKRPTRERDVF